jgi:gamma-glutamylcyclotransferase (GGCT)/AIG2-like uncharacterized protein YtfP
MTTVFVYGTLMNGERNHRVLAGAEHLGAARTVARFKMFDLGSYPGIIAGGRTSISGELYRVDAATLAKVDRLEGHPDIYRRTPIELEGGGSAEAYVLRTTEGRRVTEIPSGNWRERG